MTVIINGNRTELPQDVVTLRQLAQWESIPDHGTAIALNGKLVKSDTWAVTNLNDMDNLLVISAAYGG
ncbi:MAG: sulfur carrier protein ThiS [Muribaculaceae bacterium]|nr:sulfur carrier protein ThiS [Muribaculaceae bacterium]